MSSNVALDDRLLRDALKVGGLKTKKATVNQALLEFIQRRKQSEITKIFGTIEYFDDYDYKKLRKRKK